MNDYIINKSKGVLFLFVRLQLMIFCMNLIFSVGLLNLSLVKSHIWD